MEKLIRTFRLTNNCSGMTVQEKRSALGRRARREVRPEDYDWTTELSKVLDIPEEYLIWSCS
jgi:hypothetical protein